MADELSLVLFSLAEYFNYFAVVLILLCSLLMTIFIVRHGEALRLYRRGPGQGTSSLAFQRSMTEFCNPFVLRLSSQTVSNISDGLKLDVSCLVPCKVYVFWGTNINPVHTALLKSGVKFLDELSSNCLLEGDFIIREKHRLDIPGKQQLDLQVPSSFDPEQLGPPPRQRYPCVVIMAAPNRLINEEDQNTVVALVTVIHVKDSQCRMNTHIMAQYAKLAGQAVYNVQPLFFASEFEIDGSSQEDRRNSEVGDGPQQHRSQTHSPASCGASTGLSKGEGDIDGSSVSTGGELDLSAALSTANTGDELSQESASISKECPRGDRLAGELDCSEILSAAASSDGYESPSERRQSEPDAISLPDCIVCQNQQLTCVLLPCRHACVCRSCFHQLDRCPMCRSHIESFFTLLDDDDEEDESDDEDAVQQGPRDWATTWELLNQRINDFFGL